MTARIKNISAGIRGFFGGAKAMKKEGRTVSGVQIKPGETVKLDDAQVAAMLDSSMPHGKMLAHYLKINELIDVDNAFTALTSDQPTAAEQADADAQAGEGAFIAEDDAEEASTVAKLAALDETAALAAVMDVTDFAILKEWFGAEKRTTVKEQINKRALFIKAQEKAAV